MVLVTLLAVAFVAVALAKPWATGPTGPVGSASPGAAPFASADLVPRAGAISLSLPPATTAVWTAIRWRQLAPDEPLNLVRSIVAWRGGFAALGFDATDAAAPTPLWTSADGAQWSPVPAGAATSIAPAVQVVAIAAVPDGLVALTSPGARCDGYELCGWFGPPVTAWTSADGVRWARRPVPALGTAVTWRGAALAGGPAGLVAVSLGTHAEVKRSPDGVTWITSPVDSLPTDVAVGTVQATPTGYVVAGTTAPRGAGAGPGTLWSADGRDWRVGSTVPGGGPDGSVIDGPALRTLAAGRDGLVAREVSAGDPTVERWWRSTDGRSWQSIPGFPAVDPTSAGSTTGSAGSVAIAGDGDRIVVVRGGPDGGTWVSTDGSSWSGLQVEGTPPAGPPNRIVLLPGGILVSNGSTAWYGTASTG